MKTRYVHQTAHKSCNILTVDQSSDDTAPSELVAVVDDLLNQLSSKFSTISSELIGKSEQTASGRLILVRTDHVQWMRCPAAWTTWNRTSRPGMRSRATASRLSNTILACVLSGITSRYQRGVGGTAGPGYFEASE